MKKLVFLDFRIKGDDLDIHTMKDEIGLPCDVFTKGQEVLVEIINKNVISESTRWVYSPDKTCKRTDVYLRKHLEIILMNLPVLKKYIEKYDSEIEITIYGGNKNHITLYPKHFELLNKIGVKFSISFC